MRSKGFSVALSLVAALGTATPGTAGTKLVSTVEIVQEDPGWRVVAEAEEGGSVGFSTTSPIGPLDGRFEVDPLTSQAAVAFALRGSGSWIRVRLASPEHATYGVDRPAPGDPTYDAVVATAPEAERWLASSRQHDPATLAVATAMLVAAHGASDDISAAMPQSTCSSTIWEEDCRDCCDLQNRLLPIAIGGLCAAGAGALCGVGGPMALICASTAYTLCVAPMIAINARCFRSCDPLPQKPGEGSACGVGGFCMDSCEHPQVRIPGACGERLACCGEDTELP